MRQYFKLIILCVLLLVCFLNGCTKRPSEKSDTGTTHNTQSETEPTGTEDDGEPPAIIIPQQTEPETQPIPGQEDGKTSGSGSQSFTSTGSTEPSATTEATEGTESTKATLPPKFDEDELPPIPVG